MPVVEFRWTASDLYPRLQRGWRRAYFTNLEGLHLAQCSYVGCIGFIPGERLLRKYLHADG